MAPAFRPGLLTSLVRPAARSTASFVGVGGFLGVGEREVLLNWGVSGILCVGDLWVTLRRGPHDAYQARTS
jgi:hypothetical protein